MLSHSIDILKGLQHPNGLFSAAASQNTGYSRAWIRDNVYTILGFEATQNFKEVVKTLHALLDILLKHEYKIDWMIKQPTKETYRYIHARYDPITGEEIKEEWGNKQNDSVGALLFKIGDLEQKGVKVLRSLNDVRIVQKLVWYLEAIEYWQDKDNGMWEENEEIHASSVGACVAGLKRVNMIVDVPNDLIHKGLATLAWLLPRESVTKDSDLALLSLIYPYNLVTDDIRNTILENVEAYLVREKGVIRYLNDRYYCHQGREAEWSFGFPWLAIIYKNLNVPNKYAFYMRKSIEAMNAKGELPELYFGGTSVHNENTPLGWAQSLLVVALS